MNRGIVQEIMQGKKGLYPCVTCLDKNRCPYKHNCSLIGIWHMEHENLYEQYGRTVILDAFEVATINWNIDNLRMKKALVEKRVEKRLKELENKYEN